MKNQNIKEISINLYSIIKYFYKITPIFLALFLLVNFLFNVFYFLTYDYNLIGLLRISDYYEGSAAYFLIILFTILILLLSAKISDKTKVALYILFLVLPIIYIFKIFAITKSVYFIFIPLLPLILFLFLFFTILSKNKFLNISLSMLLTVIFVATISFYSDFTNTTRKVHLTNGNEYPLVRSISAGVIIKNEDSALTFLQWDSIDTISFYSKQSIMIKYKNIKVRIISDPSKPTFSKSIIKKDNNAK